MKILVIGAGAYGLALAEVLSDKNDIIVYSVIKDEIDNLNKTYRNEKIFPGIELQNKIVFTSDIENATTNIELVIIAIPTDYIANTLELFKDKLSEEVPICIAAKGINKDTNKFAYDLIKENTNFKNISILSGPSFAIDTIKKQNIILTLAGNNIDNIESVFPKYIKIQKTTDIVGVELCGTLKNICAIGCGILEGLNASESTKASFLTIIINEIKNIIESFGGNAETIMCASGIGDIILTCTSKKSRNFTLGYLIGQHSDKNVINEYLHKNTVEGLDALISIKKLLYDKNINNDLLNLIYDIVLKNENTNYLLEYIIK